MRSNLFPEWAGLEPRTGFCWKKAGESGFDVFVITAALILGFGNGANTAIFSLIDAVLLKPLPYPQAERLVEVFQLL